MVNFNKILVLVLVVLILPTESISKKKYCKLRIINNDMRSIELFVEIAKTDKQRSRGLMYRKKMSKNKGMLFVFKNALYRNFWMKNTYLPLSIAYISKDGIINEIYDMKPLDTTVTYPSIDPAQYALEVNQGWFKKNKITTKCRILINGCIRKQNKVFKR